MRRRKTWARGAPPQLVPRRVPEDGQLGGARERIIGAGEDAVGKQEGPASLGGVPAGGDRGLGLSESCVSAVAWFLNR